MDDVHSLLPLAISPLHRSLPVLQPLPGSAALQPVRPCTARSAGCLHVWSLHAPFSHGTPG